MVGKDILLRAYHHIVIDTQAVDPLPVTYDDPFPKPEAARAMADYLNRVAPGRFDVFDLGPDASGAPYIRRNLINANDPGTEHEHGITDGTHGEEDGDTPAPH